METIYAEIADHLAAKIAGLKHVDLFNDQFTKMEQSQNEQLPFELPAILIEFLPIQWRERKQQGVQWGDAELRFHIGRWLYEDTHQSSANRTAALDVLSFRKDVHKALQNFKGTAFTRLNRISSEPDVSFTSIYVWIETYQAQILDCTADEKQSWEQITPNLDVQKGITSEQPGDPESGYII